MSSTFIDSTPETRATAARITGTGTSEQKDYLVRCFAFFGRPDVYFAGAIAHRLQPTVYNVFKDEAGKETAEMTCETKVYDDMLNGYRTLHGGCSAYLTDICPSLGLMPLLAQHVTLSLDIVCHAPAPRGAMLRIVSTTKSIGKRVLSLRCEIYDKDSGKLYVSGNHIKMPPSPPQSRL
ncbi:hypothetical protein BKA62DRAFT_774980 [Auriculariales sp. MPI-PUGE-AT-0066]|nr:hypothetical protein BKA62DRAFT_774980 [Auriculariales sp. MPI-PUGE-AT-0066]